MMAGCDNDKADESTDRDGDGWPNAEDCAPDDPNTHPGARDVRGDGCDSDCGTDLDSDGDDWPDTFDCEPDDPDVYPGAPGDDANCAMPAPDTSDPKHPGETDPVDCGAAITTDY